MNQDKYALITGATQEKGKEMAKIFAAEGFNLLLVDTNVVALQLIASELAAYDIRVINITADLADEFAAFDLYNEVKSRGITIDVLVNNAAQGLEKETQEMDDDFESMLIYVNATAVVMLSRYFLKDMRLRGSGKIINLTTNTDDLHPYYHPVYNAIKAFILNFTESLHKTIDGDNISITALTPDAGDLYYYEKSNMPDHHNGLPAAKDAPEDGAGWV